MNCREYWNKTLGESSIHGFPYLVRRELHWLERLFWAAALISATYYSLSICFNQWKRFSDNPIVYAMELAWGKSNFPFVGITLCSDYTNEDDLDDIIQNNWGVSMEQNETYPHYVQFLKVLNSLTYLNFETLLPFANDTTLNDVHFVELILKVGVANKFLKKK